MLRSTVVLPFCAAAALVLTSCASTPTAPSVSPPSALSTAAATTQESVGSPPSVKATRSVEESASGSAGQSRSVDTERGAVWYIFNQTEGRKISVQGAKKVSVPHLGGLVWLDHTGAGLADGGAVWTIDTDADEIKGVKTKATGVVQLTVVWDCELSSDTSGPCWYGLTGAGRVVKGDPATPDKIRAVDLPFADISAIAGSTGLWVLRADGTVWAADSIVSGADTQILKAPVAVQGLVDVTHIWGGARGTAVAQTSKGSLFELRSDDDFSPRAQPIAAPPSAEITEMISGGIALDGDGNVWIWPGNGPSLTDRAPQRLVGPRKVTHIFQSDYLFGADHSFWYLNSDESGAIAPDDVTSGFVKAIPELATTEVVDGAGDLIAVG